MIDRITKVFHASPDRLARLVAADRAGQEDWGPADLKMIWEHQLAAPLQADLKEAPLPSDLTSFADLLHAQAPPVSLLRQAMDFAHTQCSEETGVLPREIALALYYACIAAAQAHARAEISSLDRTTLLQGWSWARGVSWLDEPTRRLLDEALSAAAAP